MNDLFFIITKFSNVYNLIDLKMKLCSACCSLLMM